MAQIIPVRPLLSTLATQTSYLAPFQRVKAIFPVKAAVGVGVGVGVAAGVGLGVAAEIGVTGGGVAVTKITTGVGDSPGMEVAIAT
jgi:hypothetical protein